ncbi:F-box only protein 27 isoform X2 [Tiliqua scincoides]|uniref:F-box only protein 27 isoform X2 n=1 Tax=Tiliqua scincoides TaxID=71010 RepID=UPI00346191AC
MGLVNSRAELPRKKEIQCLVDLNPLPDELLVLILSWVPGRTLVTHCRLVCRRWRDLIDRPTLWKLKWKRDPAKWGILKAALKVAGRLPQMEWGRLGILEPFGRNLIKNPCGTERLLHWEVRHGGEGWTVEENRDFVEGAEAQTCFVSSYQWGAREDCGCSYAISVSLLAANKNVVIAEFSLQPEPIPQWNSAKYQQAHLQLVFFSRLWGPPGVLTALLWKYLTIKHWLGLVLHVFQNYGPGVRYVRFVHKGQDTQFWAGHYGARVTNSTVLVKIS